MPTVMGAVAAFCTRLLPRALVCTARSSALRTPTQVYKARVRATGDIVAVKVQRPAVQSLVSKDLYVLRRAAEVYQGLVERFAPQASAVRQWARALRGMWWNACGRRTR
jgi:hypothetical protein